MRDTTRLCNQEKIQRNTLNNIEDKYVVHTRVEVFNTIPLSRESLSSKYRRE